MVCELDTKQKALQALVRPNSVLLASLARQIFKVAPRQQYFHAQLTPEHHIFNTHCFQVFGRLC